MFSHRPLADIWQAPSSRTLVKPSFGMFVLQAYLPLIWTDNEFETDNQEGAVQFRYLYN